MKTTNLIRLGIDAQKEFNMSDNFRIYLAPPNSSPHVVFPIHDLTGGGFGREDVYLKTWMSSDGHEICDIGYAQRANILVIKFRDSKND